MKRIAAEHGRAIRTATPMPLIVGDSDRAAEDEHAAYVAGLDRGAIDRLYQSMGGAARPSARGRIERSALSPRRRSAAR